MSASALNERPASRPTERPDWGMHSRLLRAERIHWRRIDDEVVLLDLDTERCASVNAVGAIIWDRCDGTISVGTIIDEIAQEFDVARAQVHDDAVQFIAEMISRGFLVR